MDLCEFQASKKYIVRSVSEKKKKRKGLQYQSVFFLKELIIPSFWDAEMDQLWDFEAFILYKASSRLVKAIQ